MSAQQDWLSQLTNTIHNAADAVVHSVSQPPAPPPVSTMPVSQLPTSAATTQVNLPSNPQGNNTPVASSPQSLQLPSMGDASPRRGDNTTTGFQQFGQGLLGLPSKNVEDLPVTNPLDLTESQAMSPYGAGAALGLVGNEVLKGGEALAGVGRDALATGANGAREAVQNAQLQPGGLEAGFLGFGKKEPPIDTSAMTDAQKARVTDENPSGASPVQLQPTDLHKEYNTRSPQRVQEVQNTLDTQVNGNTPTEVYSNIQPAIEDLGKRIDQETANNPSTASKDYPKGITYSDLADAMLQRANQSGLMKDPGVAKSVKQGIAQQINYISSKGLNPDALVNRPIFDDNLNPINSESPQGDVLAQKPLDMDTLRKEYMQSNIDNKNVLSRVNPTKGLTDKQQAQLLYRNVLKDAIGSTNPKVQGLISKQHDLYDAADPVADASSAYEKTQSTAPIKKEPGTLRKIMTNPFVDTIGGAGLYYLGNKVLPSLPYGDLSGASSNAFTGNGKTGKFTLNTNLPSDITPDQAKKITGLNYTAAEYQRDIHDPRYVSGSNFAKTVDTSWANTQQQAANKLTPGAKTFMSGDAQTALDNQGKLNDINMGGLSSVWQRFKTSQDYAKYTSDPNNPYAKEMAVLQQANNAYRQAYSDITGKDPTEDVIMPGDTSEVMKEKLQAQNSFLMQTYNQYQPYWDISNVKGSNTSADTNSSPLTTTAGLPPIPQGFHMTSTLQGL